MNVLMNTIIDSEKSHKTHNCLGVLHTQNGKGGETVDCKGSHGNVAYLIFIEFCKYKYLKWQVIITFMLLWNHRKI